MKSGNHKNAKQRQDGTWYCTECGAESASFELFEEAGDFEGCSGGVPEKTAQPFPNLERAIAASKEAQRSAEEANEAAAKAMDVMKKALERAVAEGSTDVKPAPDPELFERVEKWKYPTNPKTWPSATTKWSWREIGMVTADGLRVSSGGQPESASELSTKSETLDSGLDQKALRTFHESYKKWRTPESHSGSSQAITRITHRFWTQTRQMVGKIAK